MQRRHNARSTTAQNYLSDLWTTAYKLGKVDILIDSDFEASVMYHQIHNYRRSIARNKLNPLYTKEWLAINSCKIRKPKTGCDRLRIERKSAVEVERKRRKDNFNNPFNTFNFPKGIYDGADRPVND